MKLEGTYTIHAPQEIVWKQLLNPDVLARSIPGCEKLEPNPDGSYNAELKMGIAMVRGTYRGRVELLDQVPPEHFRMKVDGQGSGGFLKGEGTLTLAESGNEILISYMGEAQVGGLFASVGQRMILSAARQIVEQFFEAFQKQVPSQ